MKADVDHPRPGLIRLGYADGERVFAPCPMFHTASTQPMAATMHAFGTFVSMGHFDPAPAR